MNKKYAVVDCKTTACGSPVSHSEERRRVYNCPVSLVMIENAVNVTCLASVSTFFPRETHFWDTGGPQTMASRQWGLGIYH